MLKFSIQHITGNGFRVSLSADTPSLAAKFKEWSEREVPVILKPSDVPHSLIARPPPQRTGAVTFLYMGEVREKKGVKLLLQALEVISREIPSIKFRFVVPSMNDDIKEKLLNFKENVSLRIEPGIENNGYFEEIERADYMLCIYSPNAYRLRGSGLVTDSLAVGTPVICMAGVGALEHVGENSREAIEIVESFAVSSVLEAMRRAVAKADFRRSSALKASTEFRKRLDPDHWFDMMTTEFISTVAPSK